MPILRSRLKSKAELSNAEGIMKIKAKNEEQYQWVFLLPENLASEETSICKLPHPQNGVECLFAIQNKKMYEIMKYKENHRSWFINDTVQKDGSINLLTPIDPLFLALPYFQKTTSQGKYLLLDDILSDEKYSKALAKLECCLTKNLLLKVCSCKGDEEYTAYKLDEEKVLNWLSKKVKKLSKYFQNNDANINTCGSISSSYMRNSAGKKNEENCVKYAWMIVSDYITATWSNKLKEKLNIKEPIKEQKAEQPPAKKQKLNESNYDCVEDYREKPAEKKVKKTAQKLTNAQKSLMKVDKTGMKSMASFFKKTPKK